MTLFVSIYTTVVTLYVHSGDESIIFKKDQHFHFGGSREGEETARCGIWLRNAPGLGSSRQSRGMALAWLCCADWLASDKNKMSPQEIGTTLVKYSPSSLYCSGTKGLEILFLSSWLLLCASIPVIYFKYGRNLTLPLTKILPQHTRVVKFLLVWNTWLLLVRIMCDQQSLYLYFRQRAFLSLSAHTTSLPQIFVLPAVLPAAHKASEQGLRGLFCFALLPQWSVMRSVTQG